MLKKTVKNFLSQHKNIWLSSKSLYQKNTFGTIIGTLFLVALLTSIYKVEIQLAYTIIFGSLTAFFSYGAFNFSMEKFRFDLLDKRWEIYQSALTFCSVINQFGTLIPTIDNHKEIELAKEAAGNSFRGIGYHKYRALFGEDVINIFEELNDHYAFFSTRSKDEFNDKESRSLFVTDVSKRLQRIREIINLLPIIFSPYVYFGQYKNLKNNDYSL
jgi:hypothetical protein